MTDIKLYNTKTRRKEPFTPIDPDDVRMYVCGPTVYDRAHIGNARPVVVFDVLFRLLRHVYGHYNVKYVRNFTDVDDKINARAAETGRPIREITDETIKWYQDDMAALGALPPTHEPRATEYIGPMIAMIEVLIEKGNAYVSEGHVLFDVNSYDAYGTLSGRKLEDMRAGERVEIADYKRDPMDFVLWKPSSDDLPGWDSPWGRGRPGWHIECSAMSLDLLGETFDIHGGGLDLTFPHHENEIAQSACAVPHGDFAKVWMHNEMLQVEGRKMSKSLGNFFTVKDLLDQGVPGEVIRFVILSTHYRSPMDWTDKKVAEAYQKFSDWAFRVVSSKSYDPSRAISVEPDMKIIEALSSDLNTSKALTVLDELSNAIKEYGPQTDQNIEAVNVFLASARFMGILSDPRILLYTKGNAVGVLGDRNYSIHKVKLSVQLAQQYRIALLMNDSEQIEKISHKAKEFGYSFKTYPDGNLELIHRDYSEESIDEMIRSWVSFREKARKNRNFDVADSIRTQLEGAGVELYDKPEGTTWIFTLNFDVIALSKIKP